MTKPCVTCSFSEEKSRFPLRFKHQMVIYFFNSNNTKEVPIEFQGTAFLTGTKLYSLSQNVKKRR